MTNFIRKTAGGAALLAASSLAIPAQAATIAVPGATSTSMISAWSIEDETANGWGHHRRWRRHRGGGDVLAGILILGGAVAVAKAIENSNDRKYRERDERYRDYRDYDRDAQYRDSRYPRLDAARRGIDGAIEDCVEEVERDERVGTVDTAERDSSGWQVGGELARGGRYSCTFSADGRVRDVDIDMGRRSSRAIDEDRDLAADRGRYDDDYYASARSRIEDEQPAFEAEEQAAEADDDLWERGEADDRYETAGGPDYALAQ